MAINGCNPGEDDGINVVFEYTEAAGGYAGVRTWTNFASQAELDKFLAEVGETKKRVLHTGVTQEQAVMLTKQTPTLSYIGSALEEAVDQNGVFHPEVFQMKMLTLGIPMIGMWGQRGSRAE